MNYTEYTDALWNAVSDLEKAHPGYVITITNTKDSTAKVKKREFHFIPLEIKAVEDIIVVAVADADIKKPYRKNLLAAVEAEFTKLTTTGFKFKIGTEVAYSNGGLRTIKGRAFRENRIQYLLAAEEDLGWEEEWVDEECLAYLF